MLPIKWLFWLLPPVFLLHDLEEIVMLAPWLARHRVRLAELAGKNRFARRLVTSIDLTPAQFSLGVAFELVLILAATLGAFLKPAPGFGFYFFLVLLGAMFLHVFTHLAQPSLFRAYTPGLVTAVVLVLPFSLYLYFPLSEIWQEHDHDGYRAVSVDLTGFWRPCLKGWPGRHFHSLAGRALPAVVFGVVVGLDKLATNGCPYSKPWFELRRMRPPMPA